MAATVAGSRGATQAGPYAFYNSMHLSLAAYGLVAACVVLTSLAHGGTQQGTDPRPIEVTRVDAAQGRLVVGDEIDGLESRVRPPRRFADHRPDWRVERRTFTFQHAHDKVETKAYDVVLDGDKVVALLRSGDILLIALTPDTAKEEIDLPTERLHLDNLPGPSLPTHQFLQRDIPRHGSIYVELGEEAMLRDSWESNGQMLTLVRRQRLPEYEVEARFTFRVDPVYGYRIDAVRDVAFDTKPVPGSTKMAGGTFTPGCYVPWEHAAIYDRTVFTPASGLGGGDGMRGWANNLVCMDRCDSDKANFAWRDGGFIAFLPDRDGWSPCFTRRDGAGDVPMVVCNAHNDFHITFKLGDAERGEDGRYHFRPVHRLLALPPEMTAKVWDGMELIEKNSTAVIIKIGEVEDFESQPVALTRPARGMVWTGNQPEIVHDRAHSGDRSILIRGRAWPNLPQVSLQPDVRYRLEGWIEIRPWDEERLAAERTKETKHRESLVKKGKDLPPETDWEHLEAKAYISGDFYEWSPYSGEMLERMRTTEATGTQEGWQHVVLEFDSPSWGPFINIAFHAEGCDALLDDFSLQAVEGAKEVTKNGSVR